MRLQRNLFIAAFVLSTAMLPCLAQATRSPEISEQDLAPYKTLGSGSIEGALHYRDFDTEGNLHEESIPENVKISFIPVTPYTQWYITEYRNVVLNGTVKLHPHGFFGIAGTRPSLPLPYLDQRVYRLVRSTITQADGSYSLKNIAPGSYFFISEYVIASRRLIEGYTRWDEAEQPYCPLPLPEEASCPPAGPGHSVDVPAHWEDYRFLLLGTSKEPIIVKNNQTKHIDHLELKAESRDCLSDSCGEFVQDQFFPKDNSLIIHKATPAM